MSALDSRLFKLIKPTLDKTGVDYAIGGAVAMSIAGYTRQTEDLDFGINASLPKLRQLTESLLREGFHAELREPGIDDPLGGVIDVRGQFGLVQIVNFADRFPAVIDDAMAQKVGAQDLAGMKETLKVRILARKANEVRGKQVEQLNGLLIRAGADPFGVDRSVGPQDVHHPLDKLILRA